MNHRQRQQRTRRSRLLFLTISVVLGLFSGQAPADSGKAVSLGIIVNKKNSVNKMTLPEARRYFLKKKAHWPNGDRVVVFSYVTKSDLLSAYSKKVLNQSKGDLRRYWIEQSIVSGIKAPKKCKSAKQMLLRVTKDEKSLGFLDLKTAKKAASKGLIKIVLEVP